MRIRFSIHRPGTTLVELLLFLAFFTAVSGIVVGILLATQENRSRQETIAKVEQHGVQLLQTLSRRVRAAERVLDPPLTTSGTIVALQMAQEEDDPSIVTLDSGALVIARKDALQTLSSTEVTIQDFVAQNTSSSDDRPSVLLTFTAVRSLGPPINFTYAREFEALVTLFPDDETQGNACSCVAPSCSAGSYTWEVCNEGICETATNSFSC